MDQKKSWVAQSTDDIAGLIFAKFDEYKEYVQTTGMLAELRNSYSQFYGSTVINDVDQSLKAIHVNHYASLIRNVCNMVTASRPAWEPIAVNTDIESQSDTSLASGLLDFYMKEKLIEEKLKDSIMNCLYLREGWLSIDWNVTSGEVYAVNQENGLPIYEGDVECDSHTILDVARDITSRKLDNDWYIVRKFKNKYDLAAKYPELEDKILQMATDKKAAVDYEFSTVNNAKMTGNTSEMVPTYTLYCKKTPALPQGRMCEILNADVLLFDVPLPYKRPYIIPIVSGKLVDSCFGHSYMMDLLPVQDALNMTISSIVTNQAANAVQNFQVPKGASPNVTQVMSGMNVWEYDPKAGKLEPMDLLRTAPEVFNFTNFLIEQQQLLSGVSEIARGTAPATMSGTAMALLQQQALQSSSGVQHSSIIAQEAIGNAIIELLQTFAVVPRVAMIAGKSKKTMLKYFSNKDINGISRVSVNVANPLTKTAAGRVEIANQLLATPNMITTPEQYIGVLTTGNLEPLYERDQSQINMIRTENEDIVSGKGAHALLTDNHPTHILEHSVVGDSPEARQDPSIMQALTAHIQEHLDLAKGMPPELAQMLKQASFYQAPPMPQAPQGAGPGQVMNAQPQSEQIAQATPLPSPAQPPNPTIYDQGGQ